MASRPDAPANPRRLALLGSPAEAVTALEALAEGGFEICGVITAPDRRRGRRQAPTPTPVGQAAADMGIPVAHDLDALDDWRPDLGVVVAYGRIIPGAVLARVPMINVHFSLLPRWRGAAPVERALLAGDDLTGVCIMEVAEGLDEGAVHARRELPISADSTAADLRAELARLGAELLTETLRHGLGEPEPQSGEVTYAAKITSEDRRIDWSSDARHIDRQIRVGGAWTTVGGSRLKILSGRPGPDDADLAPGERAGTTVGTGDGVITLVEVQPEGARAQDATDWLRGARLEAGTVLGEQ